MMEMEMEMEMEDAHACDSARAEGAGLHASGLG